MDTLILKRHDLENYSYDKLSQAVRDDFLFVAESFSSSAVEQVARYLIALEYFCQAYNRNIISDNVSRIQNRYSIEAFTILIAQGRLLSVRPSIGYPIARMFIACANKIPYIEKSCLYFRYSRKTSELRNISPVFFDLARDDAVHKYWMGWPSINATGGRFHVPLQKVSRHCGSSYTNKLFEAINAYTRVHTRSIHRPISVMANAFAELGRSDRLDTLLDPLVSRAFFDRMLIDYLSVSVREIKPPTYHFLSKEWRYVIRIFVEQYLVPHGLCAMPAGGIPIPRKSHMSGLEMNLKVNSDGNILKCKTLTYVPLSLKDREAALEMFARIESDVKVIKTWAQDTIEELFSKYDRRKLLAPSGKIVPLKVEINSQVYQKRISKRFLVSPSNPEYLANICATFEHYGYLTNRDTSLKGLLGNLQTATTELGVPDVLDLIAFNSLLVAIHPQLTASALWGLEVYDQAANVSCFKRTSNAVFLVVYKRRRGAELAEQTIQLTAESLRLVERMILVTEPLRNFLRDKGDDNWRKMCLSRGRRFCYPAHIKMTDVANRAELQRIVKAKLYQITKDRNTSTHLSSVFTLTRLRASTAVCEYIKTANIRELARALGHQEYRRDLTDHYLPEAIRKFFEDRWIRIFQVGIICEATKNTNVQLEASGFDTIDELDKFLRNHALKLTNNEKDNNQNGIGDSDQKVLVGINHEVARVILALADIGGARINNANPLLIWWCKFAQKLLSFIESDEFLRKDIKLLFCEARKDPLDLNFDEYLL